MGARVTLHAILQYLRHWRRAHGRHGTHSPFVYGFVEEVLRQKDGAIGERILRYCNAQQFLSAADIVRAKPPDVILVQFPHATRQRTEQWDRLRAHEAVTLSIDLYKIGLLFFRKEFLAKQHFILK